MANPPPLDPSDMKANQKALGGVDSFEVKDPTIVMKAEEAINNPAVSKATNDAMVASAPNLPFKLFGLEKLFGSKKKDAT